MLSLWSKLWSRRLVFLVFAVFAFLLFDDFNKCQLTILSDKVQKCSFWSWKERRSTEFGQRWHVKQRWCVRMEDGEKTTSVTNATVTWKILISDHHCCSPIAKSCLTLWPHGLQHTSFPVLHHLLEFAEVPVHWVSDAIQPSHPLLLPAPFCLQSFPVSESFPPQQI